MPKRGHPKVHIYLIIRMLSSQHVTVSQNTQIGCNNLTSLCSLTCLINTHSSSLHMSALGRPYILVLIVWFWNETGRAGTDSVDLTGLVANQRSHSSTRSVLYQTSHRAKLKASLTRPVIQLVDSSSGQILGPSLNTMILSPSTIHTTLTRGSTTLTISSTLDQK